MSSKDLVQFFNCTILRNHKLIVEDFWVRGGKIIDPEKVFYDETKIADKKINCRGAIIAPGFIDLQINGAFGIDFSYNTVNVEKGVEYVAKGLLEHGVTSFCPTIVTSPVDVYKKVLPKIPKRNGGAHGASILGVHAEGPFISKEKKGAHSEDCIKGLVNGFASVIDTYGSLENIKIITLAPELENAIDVIQHLTVHDVVVSIGHSMGNLKNGEEAVRSGATFITHLFNAMLPFHHRDPGLVGLLASIKIPQEKTVYFGIIADGIHTHPAALRIAYRTHPEGLVLVTDAISAMGLEEGKHNIGTLSVEIREGKAFIAGTNTLCGSIASMNKCIQLFLESTDCSIEYALEAATLHPALLLGISNLKGTLNFGTDADFVMLTEHLDLISTWIAGECVYQNNKIKK